MNYIAFHEYLTSDLISLIGSFLDIDTLVKLYDFYDYSTFSKLTQMIDYVNFKKVKYSSIFQRFHLDHSSHLIFQGRVQLCHRSAAACQRHSDTFECW